MKRSKKFCDTGHSFLIGGSVLAAASLGTLILSLPVSAFVVRPSLSRCPCARPSCPMDIFDKTQHPLLLRPFVLEFSPSLGKSSHLSLNRIDNENYLKDDWEALRVAAGNIARKMGKKIKLLFQEGKNKLKTLVPADTVKDAGEPVLQRQRESKGDTSFGSGFSELLLGVPDFTSPGLTKRGSLFTSDILFSNAFEKESSKVAEVLEEARSILEADSTASSLLGVPLEIEQPFTQSSSTITINGETSCTIEAMFRVHGPLRAGVVSVVSRGAGVASLDLETDGRSFRLNVKNRDRARAGRRAHGKSKRSVVGPISKDGSGNFVDAEIIEKN